MSSSETAESNLYKSSDESQSDDFTQVVVRGRGRGRGRRGRGVGAAGRARRGRGKGRGANVTREDRTREDVERVEALHRNRTAVTERVLQEMTLEEHSELSTLLLERQPGLILDALMMHNRRHGGSPFAGMPGLPWCTCGNCREMPTDQERKCCGQEPANCVSLLPHFSLYCLEEGFIRIHRQYREDITVLGHIREPGDDNREYRYGAYRHFIYWQHGSLGQGNRLVIPSCCVWRIREKFPDPQGHYTGFIPGL